MYTIYRHIYTYIDIFNSVESSRRAGKLAASADAEAATATCLTPECYTQPCGVRHELQLLSCDLSRHISAKTVTRKSLTSVQCKQRTGLRRGCQTGTDAHDKQSHRHVHCNERKGLRKGKRAKGSMKSSVMDLSNARQAKDLRKGCQASTNANDKTVTGMSIAQEANPIGRRDRKSVVYQ